MGRQVDRGGIYPAPFDRSSPSACPRLASHPLPSASATAYSSVDPALLSESLIYSISLPPKTRVMADDTECLLLPLFPSYPPKTGHHPSPTPIASPTSSPPPSLVVMRLTIRAPLPAGEREMSLSTRFPTRRMMSSQAPPRILSPWCPTPHTNARLRTPPFRTSAPRTKPSYPGFLPMLLHLLSPPVGRPLRVTLPSLLPRPHLLRPSPPLAPSGPRRRLGPSQSSG